ncbi:response regulator [Leucothrix sargassi]|nr:response regulator [Leucothrix sargassi]
MRLFSRLGLGTTQSEYDTHKRYPLANFLPERLEMLLRLLPSLALVNGALSTLAYLLLKDITSPHILHITILLNLVITLYLIEYDRKVTTVKVKELKLINSISFITSWYIRYIIGFSLIGLIWGVFSMLYISPIQSNFFNIAYEVKPFLLYISFIITLFCLSIYLGFLPSIYIGFSMNAMLPYIFILLYHPSVNYNWLGISAILFLMATFLIAWLSYLRAIKKLQNKKERKKLQNNLKAEALSLEKANQAKSKFLANASHDLRQPLHTSILLLGILEDELTTSPQKKQFLKLKEAIDTQTDLLNSLLDLSRLDAGIIKAQPTHINLYDVFHVLKSEFEIEAKSQNRQLFIDFTDEVVVTDKLLLTRILRNLLTNAFRHSRKHPISLGVEEKENSLSVYVKNSGPYATQQSLDIIHEHLSRNNNTTELGSGGLGLSIVKRLAELLGHAISVKLTPDSGVCFSVLIPYGDPQRVTAFSQDVYTPSKSIAGNHILVVDPNQETIETMQAVVEKWQCRFSFAYTEDEAIAMLNNAEPPDLIIADYALSKEKAGIDSIRSIREKLNQEVPALIISGNTAPRVHEQVNAHNMQLLNKPVNLGKLRMAVTNLLNKEIPNDYSDR